jgi:hypothetical protein
MKEKFSSILEIHPIVLVVFAFFAIAIPYSALNQPSGPIGEAVGTIETLGAAGKNNSIITSVRLQDGRLVQARMTKDTTPRRGQIAYMRTYHRLISKDITYEIYRTSNPN